ncbi:MAG: hypothetical protein F4Y82_01215 [Cenarchaeum sp. SB0665_bin_23]|nr:hypothetical protein [Cenarchaeum sp. SB0667_bin_13]MXY38029.1 hypothetical protein [Cenarchaeum sp. SB0664_bin_35]MXY60723.1 hypothetical protein [Cenarchaeum sp. SB0665_bin_23]MXZ93983.1 hypothetical protein [Cenarchaeum sp. SB0666_bin_15]MYB46226.1 hypothetical protein [Cenarchaeum sp. SB0662_bin_33]MYC79574.1 hypothetical protein [Cenarchaeum sp. SB0661_bin_35]MYD58233.1 hypothetical protein [Cenarchaeum sp. SB0678_bin_8]MYG32735.1 hypothetical protein [Cenarchaeum sp. SB0677_bin_16]
MTITLESILDDLRSDTTVYTLVMNNTSYALRNVDIVQIDTPVRQPTSRGDVYMEGRHSYRIKANIQNDIVTHLSKTMLGPSKEFGGISIVARTTSSGIFGISGSLLNVISIKDSATLSISIVGLCRRV